MFSKRLLRSFLALLAAAGPAAAEPVFTARGLMNGVSFEDAPGVVPRGGILTIVGVGLADAEAVADTLPLPTSLGDPAVEVRINETSAPLFFVSPEQINAQIPWEIEAGRAMVVVRQGDSESAAVPVFVADNAVNLIFHSGTTTPIAESLAETPTDPAATPASDPAQISLGGPDERPSASGTVLEPNAAVAADSMLRVFAAGLGGTEPELVTGSAGVTDTEYDFVNEQRAFLGGIPVVEPSVEPSTDVVGVYQMTFTVPELAGSTEVFRWVSGNQGASGVMGPVGAPEARYMAVPDGVTSAERIQMTDLNPYYLALSGAVDDEEGCYQDVHLLDLRRDASTTLAECILPSFPNAPNPAQQYRPFEPATNSGVLAALVAPDMDLDAGLSNQLMLVDSASGTTETVTIEGGADRLQTGLANSSTLRLERPEGGSGNLVVDLSGSEVDDAPAFSPLPDEVDGRSVNVVQANQNYAGGYRLRFLGPETADDDTGPLAVLFDASAEPVVKLEFPEGWSPIVPPRRLNPQGNPQGGPSLAPATGGFGGVTAAYVVARKTDGTQDGVLVFDVTLPDPEEETGDDSEPDMEPTATMTVTAIEFGDGVYAANCVTAVRWLRIPPTRTIAIAGSGEATTDFAEPRDGQICTADRLVLFNTESRDASQVTVEDGTKLDVWLKGASNNYLYFGDGTRDAPFKASTKIHVFDGTTETFREIAFPENAAETPVAVGMPFNNQLTQNVPSQSMIVAMATSGEPRTNNQGNQIQPFPGNEGLLAVDLEDGTSTLLALPEGYQRVELGPGISQLAQQGRRPFGVMPLIGRAFANVRRTGQPLGTGIVTWDVATGEATAIELPEGAVATVRPLGGPGANQRPYVWDLKQDSGAFAFGVYNQQRNLIGVAVVGPEPGSATTETETE